MARKPKKPQPQAEAPKVYDEFVDDSEIVEEDVPDTDSEMPLGKSRDWRDVEKLKEERRLRRLIDDDLDFDL
jgi:hypothetical protein